MKLLFFLLSIVLSVPMAEAASKVTGTVKDDDNTGIEYATVRFLTPDSTFVRGGATDGQGRFDIELDKNGQYILHVSALGYKTVSQTVTVEENMAALPPVILKPDSRTLDEVTVKGRNMTRVDGHLQIIPEAILVKHSSTGYQLLKNLMIPGLEVDPLSGSVALFGHQVNLYINGEPATYQLVKNLRPKDVEKIEYHDAPVGRFSTDFAAVNFIIRQKDYGGYVNLGTQQRIGGSLNSVYDGFAKINKGKTSYYLYGGYVVENGASAKVERYESFDLESRSVDREFHSTGGRDRSYDKYVNFRVAKNTSDKFMSLTAGLVGLRSVGTATGSMEYGAPYDFSQTTSSRTSNTALQPKLNFYGYFDLTQRSFLEVTMNTSFSRNKYGYLYTSDGNDLVTDTREKMYYGALNIKYQIGFKHRNSLTVTLSEAYSNTSGDYSGTYSSWQHMWNSNTKLIADYTHAVSNKFRLTLRPGLSVVNLRLHGNKQQNFYSPNLFARIQYTPLQTQQLALMARIDNTSPGLSMRSEAESPVDFILTRRGNPYLKDANNYYLALMYMGQTGRVSYSAYLEANHDHNSTITGYTTEGNRIITSFYNGDGNHYVLSPVVSWSVSRAFRIQTGGSLCHDSYKGLNGKRQLNFVTGMLSAMYMWRDFSFNLRTNFTSHELKTNGEYGFIPMDVAINVGWHHGRWNVESSFDTYTGSRKRNWTDMGPYRMRSFSQGKYSGSIRIAYTFDFGKKVKREQSPEVDKTVNSAILK